MESRAKTCGVRMFFEAIKAQWSARSAEPALITASGTVTWKTVEESIDRFEAEVRRRVSNDRPLAMLEARNDQASLVAYLALLRAGWPVILVAPEQLSSESAIGRAFGPNILVRGIQGGVSANWEIDATDRPPVDLHPKLSVLLSTSGTTGAPKLVRLSDEGLLAGARAIVEYLGITHADRAITALPFHYSYGMSVVHSQMLAGAPIVLTDHSVTEPGFWQMARDAGATSVALVPTQIESMIADGWRMTSMPSVRYITQAGGRLDPDLIRKFAGQARDEGWKLVIMYGQTEAGPRISYLPPEDVLDNVGCIGRPIPGGRLCLVDKNGAEIQETGTTGELVFEGPSVMQGYAENRSELAKPEGPKVLHTGDLAERTESGYFRLVGRKSRFLKLHGLRIGLDEAEVRFREEGFRVFATGSDEIGLFLFLQGGTKSDAKTFAKKVALEFNLPEAFVAVETIRDVPMLASGKVDYRALTERAEIATAARASARDTSLGGLLARALRDPTPDMDRSFRELGGDSLGYLSIQLHFVEKRIPLPDGWDDLPLSEVSDLEREVGSKRHKYANGAQRHWIEANLIGRVLALFAIIALHTTTWPTGGGGYLLVALVGYSLARFQFIPLSEGRIWQMTQVMLLPILTTYFFLMIATEMIWRPIPNAMFFLVANLRPSWADPEPYWFVSAYVQLILFSALLFSIRPIARWARQRPFEAGLIALAVAASLLTLVNGQAIEFFHRQRNPIAAFELAALGWGAWFAKDLRKKAVMTMVLIGIWQFHWSDLPFGIVLFCFGGLLAVLWRVRLPVTARVLQVMTFVGSLALYIYIVHAVVLSATVRLLPTMPELPRFMVVAAGSVLMARGAQLLYETGRNAVVALSTGGLRRIKPNTGTWKSR